MNHAQNVVESARFEQGPGPDDASARVTSARVHVFSAAIPLADTIP
jgi:hypothetical protein